MKTLNCLSHLAEKEGQSAFNVSMGVLTPASLGSIQNPISMLSHSEWQPCETRFPRSFFFFLNSHGDLTHLCRIYLGAALFSRLFKHLSMRRQQTHISTNTCQIHLDVYGGEKKQQKRKNTRGSAEPEWEDEPP